MAAMTRAPGGIGRMPHLVIFGTHPEQPHCVMKTEKNDWHFCDKKKACPVPEENLPKMGMLQKKYFGKDGILRVSQIAKYAVVGPEHGEGGRALPWQSDFGSLMGRTVYKRRRSKQEDSTNYYKRWHRRN